ncbi:endolytic transglycosylase MltG [bacterium]|nr:MAG: endolytic transglycosylase MltG [bacterium]
MLARDTMIDRMLASDRAYDGRFLTGVLTTGIYCLPSCRARKPKPDNVRFFPTVEEARKAGLRPCKRCRPDDYYARRDPDRELVESLVERMVGGFRRVFTEELREAARAQGFTVRQVVSLAALVEKETARPEERPIVAGVYRQRLRIGMPLQADPTVIFALVAAGRFDGNLTREGLQFDSPYNTYRYPGLPPGPIAAPGRGSLEAAARPADGDYLYFVSRNDGSHVFARTLDEHNRNVFRYQVKCFRDKRANGQDRR